MIDISTRDEYRITLLKEMYKITEGDITSIVDFEALGKELKIPVSEIDKAYYYLKDEYFIEPRGMGYHSCISHHGIKYVESLLRKLDFSENKSFNDTELFQLKIMLNEIKELIQLNHLGQEVIFNRIEEVFEESKTKTKLDWKNYLEGKVRDWVTNKSIELAAVTLFNNLLQQ